MAVGMSATTANNILNAICNNTSYAVTSVYAQLHDGDPGASGTANLVTETTRQVVSFGSPSGGAISNDTAVTWTDISASGTEDATHVSLWTAATSGTFIGSGTITANSYVDGDTFTIPVGDLDLSLTVAS